MSKRHMRLCLIALAILAGTVLCIALAGGRMQARSDGGMGAAGSVYPVRISEIMASNDSYLNDQNDSADWIELYNSADRRVDISGFRLTDNTRKVRYTFPADTVMEAGGRLVVYCRKNGGDSYADFSISKHGGETLLLLNSRNVTIDSVVTVPMLADEVYALTDGGWAVLPYATPGYENSEAGYAGYRKDRRSTLIPVQINEYQSRNSVYADEHGAFSDWIELYNYGSSDADLSACRLTDRVEQTGYVFPQGTLLPAGGFLVIRCMSNADGNGYAPFALSGDGGEEILLLDDASHLIDSVTTKALPKNAAMVIDEKGVWTESACPTPGYVNDDSGYEAFLAGENAAGPVAINEVMTGNATVLARDGVCYDWIELKNVSDGPVRLSDYRIGESQAEPGRYPLPDVTLSAGELIVLLCTGQQAVTTERYHTLPLSLNAIEETLYLVDGGGACIDALYASGLTYDGSIGRMPQDMGIFYFASPSPGAENADGFRSVAPMPEADTPGGVYAAGPVSVQLSGTGTVHYTLDGGMPTAADAVYDAPLTIAETTVLRAICVQPGQLASAAFTATYIIGVPHDLPVICVTTDPAHLSGADGILARQNRYDHDVERPAHIECFDGAAGFSLDCGIKLHGRMSRQRSRNSKLSYKVVFRGRYGTELLDYPLFENRDNTLFGSLLIRNGSDMSKSAVRDEMLSRIACRTTSELCVMDSRFCVLYINGGYAGVYALKEALSKDYYAIHYGVDVDTVEQYQPESDESADFSALVEYAVENDLREEAHFRYIAERVNLESLIDWCIFEAYCANGDLVQNVRYFRSDAGDGQWHYALFDLDMGMQKNATFLHLFTETWNAIPRALLRNETFQDMFLTRMAWHLQNGLSPESVLAEAEGLWASLQSEMPRELARWPRKDSVQSYQERMRAEILLDRAGALKQDIAHYMDIPLSRVESYFNGAEAAA